MSKPLNMSRKHAHQSSISSLSSMPSGLFRQKAPQQDQISSFSPSNLSSTTPLTISYDHATFFNSLPSRMSSKYTFLIFFLPCFRIFPSGHNFSLTHFVHIIFIRYVSSEHWVIGFSSGLGIYFPWLPAESSFLRLLLLAPHSDSNWDSRFRKQACIIPQSPAINHCLLLFIRFFPGVN
jgi:hypothetical protein